MTMFMIGNNRKLACINENLFKLEKELQKICEENLEIIFGFDLIKSEYTLHNFRIDTLAFDNQSKSFVIIEYKKDRSFSVVDQGYAHLSLLLNNKADFILEYNENCGDQLKRNEIDWSQSKVIFVSQSFTPHQIESINFKDLPIELWEVKRYRNDTILFNQLLPSGASLRISSDVQVISGAR